MSKRVTLPYDGAVSSGSRSFPSPELGMAPASSAIGFGDPRTSESTLASSPFQAVGSDEKVGQKRPRDARGIDKFKQIVYGEKGFRCLHAMVERNPILMFPPRAAWTSRQEWLRHQQNIDYAIEEQLNSSRKNKTSTEGSLIGMAPTEEVDVTELVEKRRRLEVATFSDSSHCLSAVKREEIAKYHHKQLDTLLKLMYEFNHATLLKMPMSDTLRMLSRCGREAVAHLTEFEMHARFQRGRRLEEAKKIRNRQVELQDQQMEMEDAQDARELELAEEQLREAMQSLDEMQSLSS